MIEEKNEFILTNDVEFQAYIRAFNASSSRVRWTMIVITVTCMLIFVGLRNSRNDSWFNARIAGVNKIIGSEVSPKEDRAKIDRLTATLKDLDSHRLNNALLVRVPFLGLVFDVNDLGILGGIALSILMLVLVVCMARQHENLFLGLWKVRRISDVEVDKSEESKANVLYHAMAMAEVFAKPPTLARWSSKFFPRIYRVVFLFPLIVQVLIFTYDMESLEVAASSNRALAIEGTIIQLLSLFFITPLSFLCLAYSRAADRRWARTFLYINPAWTKKQQPSWKKWLKIDLKSLFFWICALTGIGVLGLVLRAVFVALPALTESG